MSQDTFTLDAARRDDLGKGASRRLRREGKFPAIVYGGNKAPVAVTVDHNEMLRHMDHEAFFSHVLDLKIDGKSNKVILRALHRHPYKPTVLHADFQRVSANQSLRISVPLHFANRETCAGAKAGGVINIIQNEVEVDCTAANLPEYLEVDLKDLDVGDSLHLSQIPLPKGVAIHALALGEDHDVAVVAIHAPKVEAKDEEEGEEGAEPEAE